MIQNATQTESGFFFAGIASPIPTSRNAGPLQVKAKIYEHLRKSVHGFWQHNRASPLLRPTVLAHEAWLKMMAQGHLQLHNSVRFYQQVGGVMRHVLVDYARYRVTLGNERQRPLIQLDECLHITGEQNLTATALLSLDRALTQLDALSPCKRQVMEMRLFAGLDFSEIGAHLNLTPALARRKWLAASCRLASDRLSMQDASPWR